MQILPCETMLDLLDFVCAEPFQPFRFWLNDGRTLDIRHPEAVQVGKSVVSLSPFIARIPGLGGWEHRFPIASIFAIEPIE